MNEAQMVQVWRDDAKVISIGDHLQLGVVSLSKPSTNPFISQLTITTYVRFIENGWPYAMLLEVMRMTIGLEVLFSDLFYKGGLKPGKSKAIDQSSRKMSKIWHSKIRKRYPKLRHEAVYTLSFLRLSTSNLFITSLLTPGTSIRLRTYRAVK